MLWEPIIFGAVVDTGQVFLCAVGETSVGDAAASRGVGGAVAVSGVGDAVAVWRRRDGVATKEIGTL